MERLTKQEEEAMQVVWQTNGGFIKDFLELLPDQQLPYTTLASTIRKLEQKGFLKSEKLGNSYRYLPLIAEKDYSKSFMRGFVSNYFKNSYKELVSFFAHEKEISAEELKEIIDMITNRKSE